MAKLHPGIKAGLRSNNLSFKLKDNLDERTYNIRSGDRKALAVQNGRSNVTLYNPEYNVSSAITRGVQHNVGVDFGV